MPAKMQYPSKADMQGSGDQSKFTGVMIEDLLNAFRRANCNVNHRLLKKFYLICQLYTTNNTEESSGKLQQQPH